jgi:hypothetical protein
MKDETVNFSLNIFPPKCHSSDFTRQKDLSPAIWFSVSEKLEDPTNKKGYLMPKNA